MCSAGRTGGRERSGNFTPARAYLRKAPPNRSEHSAGFAAIEAEKSAETDRVSGGHESRSLEIAPQSLEYSQGDNGRGFGAKHPGAEGQGLKAAAFRLRDFGSGKAPFRADQQRD